MKKFIVEPMHFDFLAVQRGRISDLRHDFKKWKRAYDKLIEWDYQTMKPALPPHATRMLDVGGGLSGISARLVEHYASLHCIVLDGRNDAPIVKDAARTFNNATVTQNFLRVNGVRSQQFVVPDGEIPLRLDLVISIQAWGMHFGPDLYADRVKNALTEQAVVILDVRVEKERWFDEFYETFGPYCRQLTSAEKWTRWAFARHQL